MSEPYLIIPCQFGHQSADQAVKDYVCQRLDVVQMAADRVAWDDSVAFDASARIVLTHLNDGDQIVFKRVNGGIGWKVTRANGDTQEEYPRSP